MWLLRLVPSESPGEGSCKISEATLVQGVQGRGQSVGSTWDPCWVHLGVLGETQRSMMGGGHGRAVMGWPGVCWRFIE